MTVLTETSGLLAASFYILIGAQAPPAPGFCRGEPATAFVSAFRQGLLPPIALLAVTLGAVVLAFWLSYANQDEGFPPIGRAYLAYAVNYGSFWAALAGGLYFLSDNVGNACWSLDGIAFTLWELVLLFGFLALVSQIVTSGLGFWAVRK
ncbi:MAG: hypothetical protein JRN54_10205 [Nitrososphaerota archaeon]|nr:hypothetical protein [Nitrososphaerota archaeon]